MSENKPMTNSDQLELLGEKVNMFLQEVMKQSQYEKKQKQPKDDEETSSENSSTEEDSEDTSFDTMEWDILNKLTTSHYTLTRIYERLLKQAE